MGNILTCKRNMFAKTGLAFSGDKNKDCQISRFLLLVNTMVIMFDGLYCGDFSL